MFGHTVKVNQVSCIQCGKCIEVCPGQNISKQDNEVTVNAACVGCGMCIDECENNALVVEG